MIASLPMYDWPEVRDVTDAWWSGLAEAFRREGIKDVPGSLYRSETDGASWTHPDLLFSQTCGYPYTHGGSNHLRLVATPSYGLEGCDGPTYRSFLLCHKDAKQSDISEFRQSRVAVNDLMSQSGYSALRAVIAPLANGQAFFSDVMESGGHRFSMERVGQGKADLCAVDPICYALAERYVPDLLAPLRIIATSPGAPGLPFVTAKPSSDDLVARLRAGLMQAMADPKLSDIRSALFLSGTEILTDSDYRRILEIERSAVDLGYPKVA